MMKALALVILCVAFSSFSGEAFGQAAAPAKSATTAVKVEKFFRTELYFGRSRPDGSLVGHEDWKAFLAETVTPLFPDGFTVLSGFGQYRDKSGKIISEPSHVLIFLYPGRMRKESRAKIEEIRAAYIKRFDQESVLRVDLPKSVNVSF